MAHQVICEVSSRYGDQRKVLRRADGVYEVWGEALYVRVGTAADGEIEFFDYDGGPLIEVNQPPFWDEASSQIVARIEVLSEGGDGENHGIAIQLADSP